VTGLPEQQRFQSLRYPRLNAEQTFNGNALVGGEVFGFVNIKVPLNGELYHVLTQCCPLGLLFRQPTALRGYFLNFYGRPSNVNNRHVSIFLPQPTRKQEMVYLSQLCREALTCGREPHAVDYHEGIPLPRRWNT
jgi:hypothetical protein